MLIFQSDQSAMSDEEEQYSSPFSSNASASASTSSKDSANRESALSTSRLFSRRLSGDRKTLSGTESSKTTVSDETDTLLKLYGVRKGSATESPTQSLLKQRRQQQSDPDGGFTTARRKQDNGGSEGLLSGDGPSASRPLEKKEFSSRMHEEIQDITQNEYISRLLAAHNRVDDLLRSRGLSAEDESKYLRAWEEIPIIREERFHRGRTSSDSGLSTDDESERNNLENKEEIDCNVEFCKQESFDVCTKVFVSPSPRLQSMLCCQAPSSSTSSVSLALSQKQALGEECRPVVVKSNRNEALNYACARPAHSARTTSHALTRKQQSNTAKKTMRNTEKSEKVNATFDVRKPIQLKRPLTEHKSERATNDGSAGRSLRSHHCGSLKHGHKIEEDKPVTIAEQQKTLLCRLKRKPSSVSSTAEISIQHCSFYQASTRTVESFPERNVRMNLRLTERAPNKCSAAIVLPTCTRPQFVHRSVVFGRKEVVPWSRTVSQDVTARKKVGKLDRSVAVEESKEGKRQRKVNRLIIPKFFLQPKFDAAEALNKLDKDKKAGTEAEKIPTKSIEEIAPAGPPSEKSNVDSIYQGNAFLPSLSSLNTPSSLDQTATSRGATMCQGSKIAEFSYADHLLVEQFRRTKYIPRPKALQQRASPPQKVLPGVSQILLPLPSQAEFLRFPTPPRIPPQAHRHSPPPCLKRVYRSVKQFSKRDHLLECPSLRKVDHAVKKKLKIRRPKRWTPRWRRKCSGEEVEEEEVEEEEAEGSVNAQKSKQRRHKVKTSQEDDDGMTEAEKAIAASKKRQVEEQQKLLQEYDESRRVEREKEEEELKKLKEKQEKRRLEREQEERAEAERRKQEEDRRRKEEEERKARQEEEKRKKEEEKMKKQQMTAQFATPAGQGGRNFIIPKKSEKNRNDKFGNIVQAKQEMGMTKEQQEEAKRAFLAAVDKSIPISSDLPPDDLKTKIKELHQRICKLEAEKYDLEKRHERQEYDLKELNERQRQVARNNALKKGIDPTDAASSKYPPKVQIFSKYDRQIDRRNFMERRSMYDNKNAYPCFPGVPPPPAVYEKVILKLDAERDEEEAEVEEYEE
ncbi:hypothetical protein RB195_026279 [Necator americanus]|uniref:Troponin T n=1 Tax=Necator americanus TaxID=51031 RepID=A0ABR1EYF7_NECAM